jgi:hypothetical protein
VENDLKVLVDMVMKNCKVNGRISTFIKRILDQECELASSN